ncbi:MAG TPA: hypothetical protein VND64_22275 [Pirellulales bacterium]|nr:hypothetical protein [Pirellulales bacterium]
MNANHENHDGSDELLRLLGWALGRGPLAGPAEAQAAFDAAAGERLSADELAWLSRLTRGNMLSNDDPSSTQETGHISTKETGHLPSAASMRLAKMHGQRLRAELLERRDATAPWWTVAESSMAAWDGGCELATSGFESSDWGPGGAAVSAALVGGVLAVWFSSSQRRQMPTRTTYDKATLYDRALVEMVNA